MTKNGSFSSFKTVTTEEFNTDFQYGDIIYARYPLTGTITRTYYAQGDPNNTADMSDNDIAAGTGGTKSEIVIVDPETGEKNNVCTWCE